MSEIFTRIRLPGNPQVHIPVLLGRATVKEMIEAKNAYREQLRQDLNFLDLARDSDFQILIIKGSYVQHPVQLLQEGTCNLSQGNYDVCEKKRLALKQILGE